MPHTPSANVLTPFSQEIARDILRKLYRTHLLSDGAFATNPRDSESGSTDQPAPLCDQLAADYCGVPLASTLSVPDIAAHVAHGEDPWAEDLHGKPHCRTTLFPLAQMQTALRFLTLTPAADDLTRIGTPGVVTILILPQERDREMVWGAMRDLVPALMASCRSRGLDWTSPQTLVLGCDRSGSKSDEARNGIRFENAVSSGAPVLALASHQRDMPDVGRALCDGAIPLPSLTRGMIVELLRYTHSVTGEVAASAILDRLPQDSALATLHPALLANAFTKCTSLRVAARLSEITERLEVRPVTTLEDIALPASVRDDLTRIVSDLSAWQSGTLDWTDVSASVFLYGPPGNGKTLIAGGLAGAAGVPLVVTSYADCQRHGHQGDYLRAMHAKVEDAIARTPSVFFLDEMDNFQRRDRDGRHSGYNMGVVNGLLEQLSRLHDTPGVIVVGAANHPGKIDPAVLRPGRFDLHLEIGSPDHTGLMRILSGTLTPHAGRLDLASAARRLIGQSGAAAAAMVRDAKARARHAGVPLDDTHLAAALDRIVPARCDDDLHRIAIHEAGHIVVIWSLTGRLPALVRVTSEGGAVHHKVPGIETRDSVRNRIAGLLAGRAAEQDILGSASNGAEVDIQRATELAFQTRHVWALEGASLMALPTHAIARCLPGTPLGTAMNAILQDEARRAEQIVTRHRDAVQKLARVLMDRREVFGDELGTILRSLKVRI